MIAKTLLALFTAMAGLPKLGDQIREFAGAIAAWYINQATRDTKMKILDAAAMALRAKNDDERYAAAQAWRNALSRPRFE